MNAAPPAPKKGLSGLAIALIVIGVIAVIGLGTCVAGVFYVKAKAEKFADSLDGGALVLASPPEVKAELAGAKKDYVGSWKSAKGSTLDLDPEGNLKLVRDEGGTKETLTAPIAAFQGNDMQIKAFVTLTIPVTSPPHRVGDHWSMTAKGVTFERK
jgi:hypothetical protein